MPKSKEVSTIKGILTQIICLEAVPLSGEVKKNTDKLSFRGY